MKDKKPQPLNLPNQTDQFETVPFVQEMTQHQLKVLIKRMWGNIQELASQLDYKRKDISGVLDGILDGKTWVKTDIDDRFYYGHYKGFVIQWDTLNKTFDILDDEYKPIGKAIEGETLTQIQNRLKKRTKK